jgi:hypothetical protein
LIGVVTEEFGYYTLEVGVLEKQAFKEDVRYAELNQGL